MTQVPWLTLTTELEKKLDQDYYFLDTAKLALRSDIETVLEMDPKWTINFLCDIAERVGRECVSEKDKL